MIVANNNIYLHLVQADKLWLVWGVSTEIIIIIEVVSIWQKATNWFAVMLFLNGRTASVACTVGSVGLTLPRLMLFRWSDCFQWQHCGLYVIWRFLRQLYPAVSPYSFKSVWLSRAKVTEGNQYFFINSVSQLPAPMSKGKMEEKLRSWKSLPVFRP